MATSTERAAERFSNSLETLQKAMTELGLASGSPVDLVPVAQALASAGPAREYMTAVLRDLLARFGGALSRAELATLLVVAAGGTDRYDTAPEVDAIGSLDSFVDSVMGAWERHEIFVAPEISATNRTTETSQKVQTTHATPFQNEIPLRGATASPSDPAPSTDNQPRIDVALDPEALDDGVAHAVEPFWGVVGAPKVAGGAPAGTLQAEDEGALPFFPVSAATKGRRVGWLTAATAAALLAVTGSVLWRHRERSERQPPVQEAARALSNASQPETVPQLPAVASVDAAPAEMLQPKLVGGLTPVQAASSPNMPLPSPGPAVGGSGMTGHPMDGNAVDGGKPTSPNPPSAPGPASPSGAGLQQGRGGPRSSGVVGGVVTRAGGVGPTGNFLISSGVMANHLIAAPEPAYPKMAKMWGVQGEVILQAVVSRNGKVVSARALDGHHMLRGAATNAVKKWRYRPYLLKGKTTDVDTVIIVNFHLPS